MIQEYGLQKRLQLYLLGDQVVIWSSYVKKMNYKPLQRLNPHPLLVCGAISLQGVSSAQQLMLALVRVLTIRIQ